MTASYIYCNESSAVDSGKYKNFVELRYWRFLCKVSALRNIFWRSLFYISTKLIVAFLTTAVYITLFQSSAVEVQ